MPISHKHKIIFVHIPKTGGSSIERALGIYGVANSGNNTQVDEEMLFGKGLQHLTVSEVCTRVGADTCNEYFKIAFVRNPWDRALSEYRWRRVWDRDVKKLSFTRFVSDQLIHTSANRHYQPQINFVADDPRSREPQIMVDYVGYFENLEEDFRQVVERCQMRDVHLPHLNKGERFDSTRPLGSLIAGVRRRLARVRHPMNKQYRAYYNARARDLIAEIYEADIRAFGYEF